MLKSLLLTNYCQHRSLEVEFRPGLNGIVGANGSGKSNLCDAIRLLFTGRSVNSGNNKDNIRDGQADAEVRGLFDQAGTEYQIVRHIYRDLPAKSILTGPGTRINKAGELDLFIQDMFGAPIDLLLDNVFIQQTKIEAILCASPTSRLKEFQASFGLDRTEQVYRLLTVEQNLYQVTPNLTDILAEAVAATTKARAELVAAEADLQRTQVALEGLAVHQQTLQRASEAIRHTAAVAQATQQYERMTQECEAARLEADEAHQALVAKQAQRDASQALAISAVEQIKSLEKAHTQWERWVELSQRLAELQKTQLAPFSQADQTALADQIKADTARLESLEWMVKTPAARPKMPGQEALEVELARLSDSQRQLSSECQHLGSGVCPTCGQTVHGGPEMVQRKKSELAVLQEQRATVQGQLNQIDQITSKLLKGEADVLKTNLRLQTAELTRLTELARAHQLLSRDVESITSQMRGLPTEPADSVLMTQLRAIVTEFQTLQTAVAVANERYAGLVTRITQAAATACKAKEYLDQLGQIDNIPTMEEVTEAKRQMEAYPGLSRALQELTLKVGVASGLATQREGEARRLLEQSQREADDNAWVAVVRQVREAMHVSGYPALAMREYSAILNNHIEQYLLLLESPFRMWLDADMAFRILFISGEKKGVQVDASRLSGGEKIIASVAFRLAMADTFARNMGLLVLDEPSAYLDEANIVHLQNLLLRLREISQAKGRQILIVTHDASLKGFLDHVIHVGEA